MKKAITCLALSILFAGTAIANINGASGYNFRFGLLVGNSMNSLDIKSNQYVIPRKVGTKLPFFGFKVVPSHMGAYTIQTVTYFPSAPRSVSGNLRGDPRNFAKGIKSRVNEFHGVSVIGYRFDSGDPYGEYKLAILINGVPLKEIKYTVVPAGA